MPCYASPLPRCWCLQSFCSVVVVNVTKSAVQDSSTRSSHRSEAVKIEDGRWDFVKILQHS